MRHYQYRPILQGRRGEFNALAKLPSSTKTSISPVIELPPIAGLGGVDVSVGSAPKKFTDLPRSLARAWSDPRPLLVDGYYLDDGDVVHGAPPMIWLADNALELGVNVAPVFGFNRPRGYNDSVRELLARTDSIGAIRIEAEDLELPSRTMRRIEKTLHTLDVEPSRLHCILDVRCVDARTLSVSIEVFRHWIRNLPFVEEWLSLSTVASAMPASPSKVVKADSIGRMPRLDWILWREIVKNAGDLRRVPDFGDYGVQHPDPINFIPGMRISASIRYTSGEHWLLFRGHDLRGEGGHGQYRNLSRALLESPGYSGAAYSAGDGAVLACANGSGGTGTPATWREAATSHHLTYVVDQLRSLFD